ncbi:MAG TPA: hypothetical protein VHS06_01650 [Chloroflexota bacterium]|nr:hypothetical protein [Chloroflexota bacterium]
MAEKPKESEEKRTPKPEERHVQFDQNSWTEIDAEGTDSEMAQGRESQEPFYTPLVTEAAERKMKKDREAREAQRRQEKEQKERGEGKERAA